MVLDTIMGVLNAEVAGISVALIIAILGLLHVAGMLNFFKRKKTGMQVGWALLIVGGLVVAQPFIGGLDNLSVSGGDSGSSNTDTSVQKSIGTLQTIFEREADGSQSAVEGAFQVFSAGTNPSDANANPVLEAAVASGTSSSANPGIACNKEYRVVFEGNETDTFYDKDYGVMAFPCPSSDESAPTVLFDGGAVVDVGTVDDILDETATDGTINGQSATHINGSNDNEVGCSGDSNCGADGSLTYDESVGDGVWYIDVSPSASGANSELKDYVLHFQWDSTNPPEGNEYSSMTAQLRSGTDFGVPSDILNFWSSEAPIELGDMEAGQSADYRLTFTVTEANEDANDDWTLVADDLGEDRGKDIRLGTKATRDVVTYAGSTA